MACLTVIAHLSVENMGWTLTHMVCTALQSELLKQTSVNQERACYEALGTPTQDPLMEELPLLGL